MPADIVNLRFVRKSKARAERERQATENRTSFGRTKEEKARERAEMERGSAILDRHRRKTDDCAG